MERENEPDFIGRMRGELKELRIKQDKIKEFMGTASYMNMSDHAKDLLLTQRGLMISYSDILSKRISLAIREQRL